MQLSVKQHIVVAGSGPIGLYTAILLKNKYGNDIDVTVIDPHIFDYERPGIIAKKAVQNINEAFNLAGISSIDVPDSKGEPENSVFIGDLQRALLGHAKSFNVNLSSKAFASLDGKMVTTKDNTSMTCDLLIDSTGESRAVAKFTNQKFGLQSALKVERIAENPIKTHFIAYVQMSEEDGKLFRVEDIKKRDPVIYAKTMEKLREQYGWQEFADPELVISKWDQGKNGARFCFYFEIPDHIASTSSEVQETYLKDLLLLKTGRSFSFKKEEGKLKFTPFEVDPKTVPEPINTTNYSIPVALVGDARLSPEYRFGTGVTNGIGCANGLIKSINVTPDKIIINKERHAFETSPIVQRHILEVQKSYKSKRGELSGRNLIESFQIYTKAYDELCKPMEEKKERGVITVDKDKLIIETGLYALAGKFKASAANLFISAVEKKKAGQSFEGDFEKAEEYYRNALVIYEQYCPTFQEKIELHIERSKIYSNLAKICFQTDKFHDAIALAQKAFMIATKYDLQDMVTTSLKTLELSYKKNLAQCGKDFPNSKWVEKIKINEELVQIAIGLKQNPKAYTDAIIDLQAKLKAEQTAMKARVTTLKNTEEPQGTSKTTDPK